MVISKKTTTFAPNFKTTLVMSKAEKLENEAIERLTKGGPSGEYRSARRANIPVTVVRRNTIYRVTNEECVPIGKVEAAVKVTQKVYKLS